MNAPNNGGADQVSTIVQVSQTETDIIVNRVLAPAIERIEKKLDGMDDRYVRNEQYTLDKAELSKDFEKIDLQFERSRSTVKWAVGIAVTASSVIVGIIAMILNSTGGF